MRKLDPSSAAVLGHFGNELCRYRDAASMSRDALGRECWVSGSLVKAIERADRIPSQDFTQRAEKALGLGTGGPLSRLWEEAVWPVVSGRSHPEYFQAYAEVEARAKHLRQFEPLAIPGLLQTEDYAREVLRNTSPDFTEEDVEDLVRARMERQIILDGDEPPMLVAVIDENALRRPVGGPGVMRAQLKHLIEAAQRPKVVVQVVPLSTGKHVGLGGSFVIAGFGNGAADVVYYETAATGHVIDQTETVASCGAIFEAMRGEALTRDASIELIREIQGEHQ